MMWKIIIVSDNDLELVREICPPDCIAEEAWSDAIVIAHRGQNHFEGTESLSPEALNSLPSECCKPERPEPKAVNLKPKDRAPPKP